VKKIKNKHKLIIISLIAVIAVAGLSFAYLQMSSSKAGALTQPKDTDFKVYQVPAMT